jgi:hypothetical protein
MNLLTHPGQVLSVLLLLSSPISVAAQSPPVLSLLSNAPVCASAPFLHIQEVGGSAVSWNWSGPGGFSDTLSSILLSNPTTAASGVYVVTITDAGGQTNTGQIEVVVHPLPDVIATGGVVCAGDSVYLQAAGGISCTWTPATFLDNPNSCNPLASPPVPTTYTVVATDHQGCTGQATATLWVHTPAGLVCNDRVSVSLDASGLVELTPDMVLEGPVEADTLIQVSVFRQPGWQPLGAAVSCAEVGVGLTYRVDDLCSGNYCTGVVAVQEVIPPVLHCADLVLPCILPDFSPQKLGGWQVLGATPAVSDNCGVTSLSYIDVAHNLDCDAPAVGGVTDLSAYIDRRWTAADSSGNTSVCVQRLHIRRVHLAELTLPLAVNLSCAAPGFGPAYAGSPALRFNGINFPLSAGVSYCELSVAFTDTPIVTGCTESINRVWTLYDWCEPDSTYLLYHGQLIQVFDTLGPQMVCPANLTVGTDAMDCCGTVQLPPVLLQDNCSYPDWLEAAVTALDSLDGHPVFSGVFPGDFSDFAGNNWWVPDTMGVFESAGCLATGDYRVEYRSRDGCGRATACSFLLAVRDLTPPSVACDGISVVSIGQGGKSVVEAISFDDGSYDACCLFSLEGRRLNGTCAGEPDNFGPTIEFCCLDAGKTIPVQIRVTDCHQQSAVCDVQVAVADKLRPACLPPGPVDVSCGNFDPSLNLYGTAQVADNCCGEVAEWAADYTSFDTLCNRGTIVRTFTASDCNGNTATCTQRIVSVYEQEYYVQMPNDAVVKRCDGTGNFGEPKFLREDCELLGVSYEDQVFNIVPDACYRIIRSWQIINWCTYDPGKPCVYIPNPEPSPIPLDPNNIRGPVISPPGSVGTWTPSVVSVTPGATPTNYATLYDPQANCYLYDQFITVIDLQDPEVNVEAGAGQVCDESANSSDLWKDGSWWDPVVGSHDLCEAPSDLTITAVDSCTGTDLFIRYLLFLDIDRDGTQETVVNSVNLPPPGFVAFGNASNPDFSGGQLRPFDLRAVSPDARYHFGLETKIEGGLVRANVRWVTAGLPGVYRAPELPYGNHFIRWIVQDACGNEKVKQVPVEVKDCKAPTVVCFNGLSVNLMPDKTIDIWVSDALQYAADNCTPPGHLQAAIRRVGSGSGFPVDAGGNAQALVQFGCSDLGTQPVELWVRDLAGNTDYCETYIQVQDNGGFCPSVSAAISGQIKTPAGTFIPDVTVGLKSGGQLLEEVECGDPGGYFFPQIPLVSSVLVVPGKQDDPMNGVSTYDLSLISRHILGVQPLVSPWAMLAADANLSNAITTMDIVVLRRMILGLSTQLPSGESWRFVDAGHAFSNSSNPFYPAPPAFVEIMEPEGVVSGIDFVGVKLGDVNGSVWLNNAAGMEARADSVARLPFRRQVMDSLDQTLLTFTMPDAWRGCQFTLHHAGSRLLALKPGLGMGSDHFGIHPGAVTVSWDGEAGTEFSLLLAGREVLPGVSGLITPVEVFTSGADLCRRVALSEVGGLGATAPVVGAVFPMPFATAAVLPVTTTGRADAQLRIMDALGRVVWEEHRVLGGGTEWWMIAGASLPHPGVWFYTLNAGGGVYSGKLVFTGG